jgi:hypothetical protein
MREMRRRFAISYVITRDSWKRSAGMEKLPSCMLSGISSGEALCGRCSELDDA